jgi:hypothetical protein
VCSINVQRASGAKGPTYQRQIYFRETFWFVGSTSHGGLAGKLRSGLVEHKSKRH